jgi:DnaJ-class molecular chaperone
MQAGPVQDNTAVQQWHFNILAVKVYDEDAIVTAAYKAEVLQAHPDRNHTCVNAVVKTQMLNEAKSLLLDKQKRENFERKCLSGVTNSNVDKMKFDKISTGHVYRLDVK